ncbi:hypothetical protein [Micromonospora sp. DT227]
MWAFAFSRQYRPGGVDGFPLVAPTGSGEMFRALVNGAGIRHPVPVAV